MKYLITILLGINILSGCNSKDDVPKDIIQKDQISDILMDVQTMESNVQQQPLIADSLKKKYVIGYQTIANHYHIPVSKLYKSLDYYIKHPKILSEQLNGINDSFQLLVAEQEQILKKKLDTVQSIKK